MDTYGYTWTHEYMIWIHMGSQESGPGPKLAAGPNGPGSRDPAASFGPGPCSWRHMCPYLSMRMHMRKALDKPRHARLVTPQCCDLSLFQAHLTMSKMIFPKAEQTTMIAPILEIAFNTAHHPPPSSLETRKQFCSYNTDANCICNHPEL